VNIPADETSPEKEIGCTNMVGTRPTVGRLLEMSALVPYTQGDELARDGISETCRYRNDKFSQRY
jgi:hypothetical protein